MFNDSNLSTIIPTVDQDRMKLESIILTSIWLPIYFIGLLANIFVCLTIMERHRLRSSLYRLILSNAASDVLGDACILAYLCLTVILSYYDYSLSRQIGNVICKIIGLSVFATYFISIFTLTLLSIDRYYGVVKLRNKHILSTNCRIVSAIVITWIAGFAAAMPFIWIYHLPQQSSQYCDFSLITTTWGQSYAIALLIIVVFVPFILIIYCYAKVAKKIYTVKPLPVHNYSNPSHRLPRIHKEAIQMIMAVTGITLISALTIQITLLIVAFQSLQYSFISVIILLVAALLLSVLRPLLYCKFNASFRHFYCDTLKFYCCGHVVSAASSSNNNIVNNNNNMNHNNIITTTNNIHNNNNFDMANT